MLSFLTLKHCFCRRDGQPDCAARLLCESNQQAAKRGLASTLLTYVGGLLVSLTVSGGLSGSLEAMREGRQGGDCTQTFRRCDVTL